MKESSELPKLWVESYELAVTRSRAICVTIAIPEGLQAPRGELLGLWLPLPGKPDCLAVVLSCGVMSLPDFSAAMADLVEEASSLEVAWCDEGGRLTRLQVSSNQIFRSWKQ